MKPIGVIQAIQLLYISVVIELVRGIERAGYQYPRNGILNVLGIFLLFFS